jgi:hypothetical protein
MGGNTKHRLINKRDLEARLPCEMFIPGYFCATPAAQEICHFILGEPGAFSVCPQIVVQFARHEGVGYDQTKCAASYGENSKRKNLPKTGKLAGNGKMQA